MTRTLLFALALLLGCAGTPDPVERSTGAVIPKDIGVVRAAAMSSLMRMGLLVSSSDTTGSTQAISAHGDDVRMQVTVSALTSESTRMAVSARGAPAGEALASFVDGVEGVLGPDAQGWQPPR